MKKMILVALASLVINPLPALAEEQMITIDSKQIGITDISNTMGSSEKKVGSDKLSNGVYIIAFNAPGGARLPNAETVIKQRFTAAGFKISENLDESSIAIQFFAGGSLNMVRADQGAAQTLNAPKMVVGAGVLASTIATVGAAGGAGYVLGALIPQDEEAILEGGIVEKPIIKTWFGNKTIRSSIPKGEYSNIIEVEYSLPKEEKDQATQDVILKMAADQWIKRYISQ